jgi:predicted DNA-binding transcriptional regulator AlpA
MAKNVNSAAAANFDCLPNSARVGSRAALAVLGLGSLVTLWRWERQGRIPPSKKIAGSRHKTWSAGELRAVIAGEQ